MKLISFLKDRKGASIASNISLEKLRDILSEVNIEKIYELDASSLKLKEFKDVLQKSYMVGDGSNAIIISSAHSMRQEIFNSALKRLEEPGSTFFFFLTESELPATVKSRSVYFDFLQKKDLSDISLDLSKEELIEKVATDREFLIEYITEYFIKSGSPFLKEVMLLKRRFNKGINIDTELMILLYKILEKNRT